MAARSAPKLARRAPRFAPADPRSRYKHLARFTAEELRLIEEALPSRLVLCPPPTEAAVAEIRALFAIPAPRAASRSPEFPDDWPSNTRDPEPWS